MSRWKKHPMGYDGHYKLMYNMECLKKGHRFENVCKMKEHKRWKREIDIGKHAHDNYVIIVFPKNSNDKTICVTCNTTIDEECGKLKHE